ncbi:GNAT family N-acetyltransferase [Nisaea nitritireducens]|uniref:GNAT family N-acetyltransferase n=1 Tax=Nisaea nitritireducens TaxID=568392 RepID=UPI001868CE5D|nr:GNAT family protein [Nisaea nitritireducens]
MTPEHSVTLRAPRPSDIDARLALGYSAEINRMFGGSAGTHSDMTREQASAWYRKLADHPCGWIIEVDGALAGEARLDNINRQDQRARMAIGLFSDRSLGRGIGRTAVRLVLDQAFGEMRLHRVDLRVLSFNERAIRCYRACGFRHEGTERESAFVDGARHDDWIMGILRPEYEASLER